MCARPALGVATCCPLLYNRCTPSARRPPCRPACWGSCPRPSGAPTTWQLARPAPACPCRRPACCLPACRAGLGQGGSLATSGPWLHCPARGGAVGWLWRLWVSVGPAAGAAVAPCCLPNPAAAPAAPAAAAPGPRCPQGGHVPLPQQVPPAADQRRPAQPHGCAPWPPPPCWACWAPLLLPLRSPLACAVLACPAPHAPLLCIPPVHTPVHPACMLRLRRRQAHLPPLGTHLPCCCHVLWDPAPPHPTPPPTPLALFCPLPPAAAVIGKTVAGIGPVCRGFPWCRPRWGGQAGRARGGVPRVQSASGLPGASPASEHAACPCALPPPACLHRAGTTARAPRPWWSPTGSSACTTACSCRRPPQVGPPAPALLPLGIPACLGWLVAHLAHPLQARSGGLAIAAADLGVSPSRRRWLLSWPASTSVADRQCPAWPAALSPAANFTNPRVMIVTRPLVHGRGFVNAYEVAQRLEVGGQGRGEPGGQGRGQGNRASS